MPILAGDIKLYESDTMNDTDQGGGRMTGNEIVDGQSNNIFEDISTVDRVYGAVNMRKVFMGVNTQTTDKYFDAHAIISKLPGDTKIGVNMFYGGDWFDRRPSAQSRVENYRARGGVYNGYLWGTQWKDSQVITIFQSETAPVPDLGEVLFITNLTETQTQFIKIVERSDSLQQFEDAQGVFTRRIVTLTISQPLLYDFIGQDVVRNPTTSDAHLENTIVANASKYYSSRPTKQEALPGDLNIYVDDIYSQVVPSSLKEVAILDANARGITRPIIESNIAGYNVSLTTYANFEPYKSFYLGTSVKPGTLNISTSSGTMTDSNGNVLLGTTIIGTIDYQQAVITFSADAPIIYSSKTIQFEPATAPEAGTETEMLAVNEQNRGFIWNITLNPPPKPGSLQVSYLALGTWYNLYDNGDGGILGEADGVGSGTVNYLTGTVSVTLSSLPDTGSAILFNYGKDHIYQNDSFSAKTGLCYFNFTLNNSLGGIDSATFSITWNDGTARTATIDSIGNISGDATGKVNLATGEVKLIPNIIPPVGTVFTFDYSASQSISEDFTGTGLDVNGLLSVTLANQNIVPGTVDVKYTAIGTVNKFPNVNWNVKNVIRLSDDGVGGFTSNDLKNPGSTSIDYINGVITFDPTYQSLEKFADNVITDTNKYTYNFLTGIFESTQYGKAVTALPTTDQIVDLLYLNSEQLSVTYKITDTTTAKQETFTANILQVDLLPNISRNIVPSALVVSIGNRTYHDISNKLYYDIDPTVGSGTYAGTVAYATGIMSVTDWLSNINNEVSANSLLTATELDTASTVYFRVPQAPVKSQSLQIRGTLVDGTLIDGVSDVNGIISGTLMSGSIDYQTGVVTLYIGEYVPAAGNETELWYSTANLDGNGNVWKPSFVLTETLLYNATAQSFLPLDESILGLNPVRLPQDGRIPVFDEGDVVVIKHDQVTTGTYIAGDVVNFNRGRIAQVSVRDSVNGVVPETAYTVDLDVGTLTWVDVTGISQPITITDTIEDMALLTEVQITGKLTLSQPITHTFPTNETLVCNAVIFGDKFAHTSIPFDQKTWTGEWSDVLIGDPVSTAEYNNTQYPIVVDNAACIEERWAIIFSSATLVDVIGENSGQILTTVDITTDIAPINPNTGTPYFTIPAAGWGGGWSAGNVLRFNTYGANAPLWIIQSVGQGDPTDPDYNWCISIRGDIDTV